MTCAASPCTPPPPENGVDVSHLLGSVGVIDMQQDPQRSAFNRYRTAHRANSNNPNLMNAAALVEAWNGLAEIMGLTRI